VRLWSGSNKLRIWSSGGLSEYRNEPSDSTKSGKFLTSCVTMKFQEKNPTPRSKSESLVTCAGTSISKFNHNTVLLQSHCSRVYYETVSRFKSSSSAL
jgi:hypothetical protein